jgi:hypothetical protein
MTCEAVNIFLVSSKEDSACQKAHAGKVNGPVPEEEQPLSRQHFSNPFVWLSTAYSMYSIKERKNRKLKNIMVLPVPN